MRTKTNPSYGLLWWLNVGSETVGVGANSPRRAGQYIPAAPADLVGATGALVRKLFIVPGCKLIVVCTGRAARDQDGGPSRSGGALEAGWGLLPYRAIINAA